MITIDELKVQLADYAKAVKDLEEALAIEASRKRVQELEHTMSRPGFYDDADLSKKVFDEVGDLKGKLSRFEKLQGLYDDAETMIEMLDEEYDPAMIPEAEEAVNAVGKAVDELQLMTMLNGEYDHSNAILTFHAGTGGTEAQDWAEMLYRMYNKWAVAHGMTVEVLDYQDGDEAGNDEQGRINEIFHTADAEGAAENGQHHPEAGADVNRYPEQGEMNHAREGKGRFPFCQARRMCMHRFGVGAAQRIVLKVFHEAVFHHPVLCRAGRPGV